MTNAVERANTLKTAYRICSPEPLSGENLEKYYVDLSAVRKTEAIESVNSILDFQEPGEFNTLLFTGHRGCGKSTELKRIQKNWEKDFRIVYLEVNDETDINDAEYTDLYLIVIQQIEYELRKIDLKFEPYLLKRFEDWFKEITEETEQSVNASVSVEGEAKLGAEAPFLAKLLVKLMAQIKNSTQRKTTIRQTLQRDVSRLKADINQLLKDAFDQIKWKYPKGFLVIFDNLDRVPPNVGDRLFFDYAKQLQELNVTLIYTVPISVLCSTKNINNTFSNPHIMPMVNIYEFERDRSDLLNYNQSGLDAVISILDNRVQIDAVFESRDQVLELAKARGGHVRQLMSMMRVACVTAKTRGHAKILAEDVTYAINQEQFNFERFIPEEHYPILTQVFLNKDVDKNKTGQLMLYNTSVLEYHGENRWNYPNPMVIRSDLFQSALNRVQSQSS